MAPLATGQTSPPSGSHTITPSIPPAGVDRAAARDGAGAEVGGEPLGAQHHALLVGQYTDDDVPRETAEFDRPGGVDHRGDPGLHVGRTPTAQPTVDDVTAERVERPARSDRPR